MTAKDKLLSSSSLVGVATALDHLRSIDLTGPITVINNPVKLVPKLVLVGGLTSDIKQLEMSADVEGGTASSSSSDVVSTGGFSDSSTSEFTVMRS